MKCEWLIFFPCHGEYQKLPHFATCLYAEERMIPIDGNPSVEDMVRIMLMDEKNIWKQCDDYFDRIMDLYSLENESE